MKIILSVTNDLVTDHRVNRVALSLLKLNYDVTLIGRRLNKSLPVNERSYKTKRIKLLFNKGPLFYAEYNIRLFFYLLFKKFDVFVANDLDTLPANYCVSVIRNKILVYDSHEYFTEVPELLNRNFPRKVWLSIESFILPKVKYSYTVCDSIANEYHTKYGIEMKVVRNIPVYKKRDIKDNSVSVANATDNSDKKIILCQGAVNIGRGIEYVIKAMKYIDNAVFVVIGDGDILEELMNLTKQINMQAKVVFINRIPINELYNYTLQADIGICFYENLGLSYYYTLPNKLFDYIHANVPVLASSIPEIKKIINDYNIGITVDNLEPEYIAEKIKIMLDDKERRKIWKRNCKNAAKELCWEEEEKKLLDLYREIKNLT